MYIYNIIDYVLWFSNFTWRIQKVAVPTTMKSGSISFHRKLLNPTTSMLLHLLTSDDNVCCLIDSNKEETSILNAAGTLYYMLYIYLTWIIFKIKSFRFGKPDGLGLPFQVLIRFGLCLILVKFSGCGLFFAKFKPTDLFSISIFLITMIDPHLFTGECWIF